jgi:Ca-activated chloride channel family protein
MNVTRMLSGCYFLKSRCRLGSTLLIFLVLLILPGCKAKTPSQTESGPVSGNSLELTFTYGSEKEKWINEVTAEFNRGDHRTSSGKRIYVRATPMGSGEAIDEVMEGRRQPDLISPASAAFTGGDRHVETDGGGPRMGQEADWVV